MHWIEPTIINIHSAPSGWQDNPGFVYIGRYNSRYGLQRSIWHNPHSMKALAHLPLNAGEKRVNVINKYASYLEYNADLLQQIPQLSGKTLVCWCKPHGCHGDILCKARNMLVRLSSFAHRWHSMHETAKQVIASMTADKVAIVGSRNYPHRQQVADYVAGLPPHTIIVSGGARGVDRWAEESAKANGLATQIFPAEWNKNGKFDKSAGYRRNADIVTACDRLVAFWDGQSRGTQHSIGLAEKAGKPVLVITQAQELGKTA